MSTTSIHASEAVAAAYRRAVRVAADFVGMPVDRVLTPRSHPERRARALAAHLTIVGAGHSLRPTARVADIDHAPLLRRLRAIEDRRDDPVFDTQLTRLEEMMQ